VTSRAGLDVVNIKRPSDCLESNLGSLDTDLLKIPANLTIHYSLMVGAELIFSFAENIYH
jgi:hypothetical protein